MLFVCSVDYQLSCISLFLFFCVIMFFISGYQVVSMRPMTPAQALIAVELTARYARVHGAPIHIGNPVTTK